MILVTMFATSLQSGSKSEHALSDVCPMCRVLVFNLLRTPQPQLRWQPE